MRVEMDLEGEIWIMSGDQPIAQVCPEQWSGIECFSAVQEMLSDHEAMDWQDAVFQERRKRQSALGLHTMVRLLSDGTAEWTATGRKTWREAIKTAMQAVDAWGG